MNTLSRKQSTLQTPDGGAENKNKSGQSALEMIGIRKQYKDFVALQHIDLSLGQNELLCFLGPSGCGKTTLLRLIAGLDEIEQGQLIKNGEDISQLKAEKRRCGIVFQNYALFPNLTIADNITYGLQGAYWSNIRKQERVTQLLEMIGLSGSEKKYPLQLSGGQQQRVALARAIASEPDILLLDEPLSALDARVRLHLRQEIRTLQQRLHIPTILVTHDQEEALTLADRIVVMNHGVIEQVDTPENIYKHPATRFVATFIGHMNLLPAKIKANHLLEVGDQQQVSIILNKQFLSNTPIEIGFRPEDAQLVDVNDNMLAHKLYISAFIKAHEFLGAKARLHLALDNEENVQDENQQSYLQIDIDHHLSKNFALDQQVCITVDHDRLHVFETDGGALC